MWVLSEREPPKEDMQITLKAKVLYFKEMGGLCQLIGDLSDVECNQLLNIIKMVAGDCVLDEQERL
jgi:hypothetical protein